MTRLPGTGIPVGKIKRGTAALVVCGENLSDVLKPIGDCLSRWEKVELSIGYREFNIYQYTHEQNTVCLLTGGLGSASVELLLQEGALAGITQFVLAGTCASLREAAPVGQMALPTRVYFRPGSLNEYVEVPNTMDVDSPLQSTLAKFLSSHGVPYSKCSIVSTDAFYGIGAAVDSSKNAVYPGAKLKNGLKPKALPLAIENPLGADCLDMECAPFFGLGSLIEGVEVAAIKVPTNKIPWSSGDFDETVVKDLLSQNLQTAIEFVTRCGYQKASGTF